MQRDRGHSVLSVRGRLGTSSPTGNSSDSEQERTHQSDLAQAPVPHLSLAPHRRDPKTAPWQHDTASGMLLNRRQIRYGAEREGSVSGRQVPGDKFAHRRLLRLRAKEYSSVGPRAGACPPFVRRAAIGIDSRLAKAALSRLRK